MPAHGNLSKVAHLNFRPGDDDDDDDDDDDGSILLVRRWCSSVEGGKVGWLAGAWLTRILRVGADDPVKLWVSEKIDVDDPVKLCVSEKIDVDDPAKLTSPRVKVSASSRGLVTKYA